MIAICPVQVMAYKEFNENEVVGLNDLIKVVVRQNNNVRGLRHAREDGEGKNESENSLHGD